jgi:hypothetical protein
MVGRVLHLGKTGALGGADVAHFVGGGDHALLGWAFREEDWRVWRRHREWPSWR